MKTVLVFAACLVTLASPYPASDKIDLVDPEFDPFGGKEPVVDTGYFDSYYPSFLDTFNKRIQDLLSNFRQSIYGDPKDLIPSLGDLGEGNTTSYTKIVGNHRVEVNETEYKKDTDFGTSHVKISYVNVRPLHPDTIDEPTGTTEADTEPINKPADRDRESLETVENEIIPNNIDEASDLNIETLGDIIKNYENKPKDIAEEELQSVPEFEDLSNDIEIHDPYQNLQPQPLIDLSGDTRVNDIMLADGAPHNADAEFIGGF